MFSGMRAEHVAGLRPKASGRSVETTSPVLGAGAFVIVLFSASAVQAQCTSAGMTSTVISQAADAAVAGVSASLSALVSSINSVNTAFLTQSSAFIGSPANPQPDQQGGGVWARGVGGHVTYSTTTTAGNITSITMSDGPPRSVTCNTRTLEDFAGIQIGTDLAKLNVNGWNLHAGATVGYLGSKAQDATPAGLNPAPSFHDSLLIPFVGAYGAASYGGFLVDGQVRGDFFQSEVSDDNQGLSRQHFNARGMSLTGNVAYNQNLGNHWFIEPSAGIVWSRTRVDPLNVPGIGATGGPGFVPPWFLTINDIESTLGRLGVRVGTTVTSGNVVLQPFASASVLHEFQGGVTSSLLSNFSATGGGSDVSATVSTSALGTYGQFGAGVAAQVVNTGWVGYLRGDYRTGDNIEGWSVSGGLRYQFIPDPPASRREPKIAKAPAYKTPPARAAYNWTGFYIGAYLGADWGLTNWSFADAGTTNPHFAGFVGGGEIGYNYQVGKWVFGLEGDAGWTNARGTSPCPDSFGFFYNCESKLNWLSTATARIGYAYWDRLLAYMKVGAAVAQDRAEIVCNIRCPSQSDSRTKAGWTVGWGTEFGLTQNASVKSEIMYFDLGSDRYNMGGIPADVQRSGFISTIGLHYRFGG